MAAVSPCCTFIGRLSPLPCLITRQLHVCYISQLLRDSFSVSQQPPIWELPSHYSMISSQSLESFKYSSIFIALPTATATTHLKLGDDDVIHGRSPTVPHGPAAAVEEGARSHLPPPRAAARHTSQHAQVPRDGARHPQHHEPGNNFGNI